MKKITTILLVEDDLDDRDIFSEALSTIDGSIRMEFASNGADALLKLQSGHFTPDAIFSDINMPKMNGIQLLEKIQNIDSLNRLPVIIYTTSSDPDYLSKSRLFGALYYIIKPNNFEKICSEIRVALDKIPVFRTLLA